MTIRWPELSGQKSCESERQPSLTTKYGPEQFMVKDSDCEQLFHWKVTRALRERYEGLFRTARTAAWRATKYAVDVSHAQEAKQCTTRTLDCGSQGRILQIAPLTVTARFGEPHTQESETRKGASNEFQRATGGARLCSRF